MKTIEIRANVVSLNPLDVVSSWELSRPAELHLAGG